MERRDFLKLTGQSALAATVLSRAAGAQTETMNHLTYPLQDGWIHSWLVAGPQNTPVAAGEYKFNPELRPPLVQQYFVGESMVTAAPVEGEVLRVGEASLPWKLSLCDDDHLIDISSWHPKSDYVRAWAYCELHSPEARQVSGLLASNGPIVAFLNGERVLTHREFDYFNVHREPLKMSLRAGVNLFLVRFDHLITRNAPHTLAVRLDKADDVEVRLPTRSNDVARRQLLQSTFDRAHLSRDSYGDGDEIIVHLPATAGVGAVKVELRSSKGTAQTATWQGGAEAVSLGTADTLPEGSYSARLSGGETSRDLAFEVVKDAFSAAPYGTFESRKREALEASLGKISGLRRELARMALGRWDEVEVRGIDAGIKEVVEWKDGGDGELMSLLGMLIRYGDHPQFPSEVVSRIEAAALKFRYWTDEPGRTAMTYGSENHQITFHTAEILAGQMYPDRVFSNNGQTGAQHRAKGERLAAAWLQTRAAYGYEEWDANGYLAADMAILSHLMLAENPKLREGAAQAMHKIAFCVAVGSWKGSYATAHSRTQGEYIKDARREPIANIARLLWGVGAWNKGIGSASMVAASDYRLPPVIEAIALDRREAIFARQRQGRDSGSRNIPGPADTVVFKTPDYQLACASDYRAGGEGANQQQHIWNACLGPESNVWVNHPACMSENGNRRPNFWMGNQTFPRVAQHEDALVALYRFRDEDWLDFTHAHFPTWAFDEWKLAGDWAFARRGDGYLALRAQSGLAMVERGKSAMRELRSFGRRNAWICQMGRRAQDGDFASFRAKVAALPVKFGELSASWATLRGQQIAFGWSEPLRVNGREVATSDFPQFDNPYAQASWPADEIRIAHAGQSLVLKS